LPLAAERSAASGNTRSCQPATLTTGPSSCPIASFHPRRHQSGGSPVLILSESCEDIHRKTQVIARLYNDSGKRPIARIEV